MGDYVKGFGNEDARDFGNTLNEIRFWEPTNKLRSSKSTWNSTRRTTEKKRPKE
jgi:hypothetical protein